MSRLETFFAGSDTHFGIFFPTNYMVAIFPEFSKASEAENALRHEGFGESELLAVPGTDVVAHAHENLEKSGLWGRLMSELSRLIGTEAVYADEDLAMARNGAGFLAVQAPNETRKQQAWAILEPLSPMVARYYTKGGIELFRGSPSSGGSEARALPLK